MIFLTAQQKFPEISQANSDGLLAIGGDLSVNRLMEAYQLGIFPWFDNDQPILWWSPDPRFVLFPKKLKVSKSMKQVIRNTDFEITINKAFSSVIQECAIVKRQGQSSTWITTNMIEAYCMLHDQGIAISVEVWLNNDLVGGLYGIDVQNKVFCGESMFTKVNNASKVGLISFIQQSNYELIDCQVYTDHLASLGAENISRNEFLKYLS
jgi:leucyl/phenylalanyl-tRNA--protein transferase